MIDFLIALGMVASFMVFAVCLWLIRTERNRQKMAKKHDALPPENPDV